MHIKLFLFERIELRNLKKAYNKMGVIKKGVGLLIMVALLVMPLTQVFAGTNSCKHVMGVIPDINTSCGSHSYSVPYYDLETQSWKARYRECEIQYMEYYDHVYCTYYCGYYYNVVKYNEERHSSCGQ